MELIITNYVKAFFVVLLSNLQFIINVYFSLSFLLHLQILPILILYRSEHFFFLILNIYYIQLLFLAVFLISQFTVLLNDYLALVGSPDFIENFFFLFRLLFQLSLNSHLSSIQFPMLLLLIHDHLSSSFISLLSKKIIQHFILLDSL